MAVGSALLGPWCENQLVFLLFSWFYKSALCLTNPLPFTPCFSDFLGIVASLPHPPFMPPYPVFIVRMFHSGFVAGDTVPVSMNEEGAQALELGSPDQIHGSVRFWVKSCALGLCVGCYAHLACMRVLQIQTQGFMLAWPVHSLPIHLSTHGMVSPTFRMGLLYTVKPFRKCFQSHTQRCVSMVILNSVKSILKIAHHRGCW